MFPFFLQGGKLGSEGTGPSTPAACYDLAGTIEAPTLTGTVSENTITMTLLPNNLQGQVTVEPAIGTVGDNTLQGEANC